MEEIAFDLPQHYPPVEPDNYAEGFIQSIAFPNLCLHGKLKDERYVREIPQKKSSSMKMDLIFKVSRCTMQWRH
jgi:hypothetical protein